MKKTFFATLQSMFNRQVDKGAAKLDKLVPNWDDMIDLDRLNLIEPDDCVCGQLKCKLGMKHNLYYDLHDLSFEDDSGFNVNSKYYYDTTLNNKGQAEDKSYDKLTNTWKKFILKRRAEKAAPQIVTSANNFVSCFST